MAEFYLLPALQAMLTAPAPGTQQVYVANKQLVTPAHKPHSSALLTGPSERSNATCATSTAMKLTLKEATPLLTASKQSLSEKMQLPRSSN